VTLLLNPDFSGNANVEVVGTQEHVRPVPVADYLPAPERIPGSEELPRLLVVEDDDELRSMFGTIFAQHYRVTLAADGTEGLRLAREEQPDLIVSDVLMPGMSGTELCAAIKREFGTCHIPVILLTALSSPEQRITGLESGADDYVSKPFDMDVLMAKCNGMVRNRRLLQRKFLEGSSEPASEVLSGNPMDEAFVRKTLALIGGHLDSESLGVGMLPDSYRFIASSMTEYLISVPPTSKTMIFILLPSRKRSFSVPIMANQRGKVKTRQQK